MSRHILLIDDDEDEFDFLKTVIHELSGLNCSYANSARKGIALLKTGIADVVLLDMNMPEMNGYECLQEILKEDVLHGIPLYIYSNSITHPLSKKTLALGATGFIKKPRTMKALREIIRQTFLPDGLTASA